MGFSGGGVTLLGLNTFFQPDPKFSHCSGLSSNFGDNWVMANDLHDKKGRFSSKQKGKQVTPLNAENVHEFIPAQKPKNLPINGNRIVPERGLKYGKGNPEWKAALKWALMNYQTTQIERAAALRAIALGVVDKAVNGDKDAYTEIAMRLDGKPIQAVEVQQDTQITIVHRME